MFRLGARVVLDILLGMFVACKLRRYDETVFDILVSQRDFGETDRNMYLLHVGSSAESHLPIAGRTLDKSPVSGPRADMM